VKKDTIIAVLVIVCLIELLVIFGYDKPVSLSVEEKAQILYDYGCELDYKAIEQFAEEWNLYVESAQDYITPEIEYH
jgi:hypothetical protein